MATPVTVSRIQNRRGTQAQFNALYPSGYTGVGGYNPPGTGPAGFTAAAYPNVLLPGELAVCTDTRRVYIGNANGSTLGEYIELEPIFATGETMAPTSWSLVGPVASFQLIPGPFSSNLSFSTTPFFTIEYSVTDVGPNWEAPGVNYSKNGEIKVTATTSAATLIDEGVEMNPSLYNLSFMAQYTSPAKTNIQILYMHNYPGTLTLRTSSIRWIPFA
jgi:hypothetical protein